jgi:7-cyano-7-deazaguanine reductase
VKATSPKQMTVRGDFGARGGIQLSCEARYPDFENEDTVECGGAGCGHAH